MDSSGKSTDRLSTVKTFDSRWFQCAAELQELLIYIKSSQTRVVTILFGSMQNDEPCDLNRTISIISFQDLVP